MSLKYDHFRVLTSDVAAFGGKCPLCGTRLEANVAHECSNGKPIIDVKPPKRSRSKYSKNPEWKGCKK